MFQNKALAKAVNTQVSMEEVQESVDFIDVRMESEGQDEPVTINPSESIAEITNVTSFENISLFLVSHKYPPGLNLNQKRTLRKAAANFCLTDGKLYYSGKSKRDKRLVVLDEHGKRQVFKDCHGFGTPAAPGGHWGQKKTLEKIESSYFWRGMVKDVINWIQSCEYCQQKEEKRNPVSKKLKPSNGTEDAELTGIRTAADDPSLSAVIDPDNNSPPLGPSLASSLEETKFYAEQLQRLLHHIHQSEQEALRLSERADLDIDDVLDHLLNKIVKLITRKKREMKAQVEERKTKALTLLKNSRKQVETRLQAARKSICDMENTFRENQPFSATFLNRVPSSLPEVPRKEDIAGMWSVFNVGRATAALNATIDSCGTVMNQPPYSVRSVLQLPSSLRLSIESDQLLGSADEARSLRLYFCPHDPTIGELQLDDGRIRELKPITRDGTYILSDIEPHQVYAIYLSYKEEGASDWSPWSPIPVLASTPLPAYSWDSTNGDWSTSSDHKEAGKIVSSSVPLYSPSAQFFPGCRLTFTIKEMSSVHVDDGFALVEQWVPGGKLCHAGTLFINTAGQLYVDGTFVHLMEPLDTGGSVTFDCLPHIETVADGLLLRLTISTRSQTHTIDWTIRSQMASLFFGMQFHTQGTQIKVDC